MINSLRKFGNLHCHPIDKAHCNFLCWMLTLLFPPILKCKSLYKGSDSQDYKITLVTSEIVFAKITS